MANAVATAKNVIEKMLKNGNSKADSIALKIDKIDAQIKDLTEKKKELSRSFNNEMNSIDELEKFIKSIDQFKETPQMVEYMCLGFIAHHGIEFNPQVEKEVKPVVSVKPKRKYNRRSKEELAKYKEWNGRIATLTKGLNENDVLSKAYDYMLRRYGVNVREERKLIFGEGSKKKPKEVMFVYETVKNPSSIGLTYDCVEKVIKGEDE